MRCMYPIVLCFSAGGLLGLLFYAAFCTHSHALRKRVYMHIHYMRKRVYTTYVLHIHKVVYDLCSTVYLHAGSSLCVLQVGEGTNLTLLQHACYVNDLCEAQILLP